MSANSRIFPGTLIGQNTDLSPDPFLARLTDASAGDSCENVKVGSRNRGIPSNWLQDDKIGPLAI